MKLASCHICCACNFETIARFFFEKLSPLKKGVVKSKGKVKIHSTTGHEGPKGE